MKPLLTVLAICLLGYVIDHWRELAIRYHAFVPAAAVSAAQPPLVTVYGSKSSSACVQLEHELEKRDISYVHKDLGTESNRTELQDKLFRIGKGSHIAIPVAEIGGVLYENATISEVSKRLH
jgi:hypothetical protein